MAGNEELEQKDQELSDDDVEGVVGGTYVPNAYTPLQGPNQVTQQSSLPT